MKQISEKQCNTEAEVSSLSTWCQENQMRINYNKTHLLIIKGNITASIDNHKLDQVKNQRQSFLFSKGADIIPIQVF